MATPAARFDDVYQRLREIARRERRRLPAGATLNTTALVHEAYLDLDAAGMLGQARDFYAYAARAMRNLVIDDARRRNRVRHGGGVVHVDVDDDEVQVAAGDPQRALELDDALQRLAATDARAVEVVELHFFAGLELGRIAELLGVSERTVNRDWRAARAWLKASLA